MPIRINNRQIDCFLSGNTRFLGDPIRFNGLAQESGLQTVTVGGVTEKLNDMKKLHFISRNLHTGRTLHVQMLRQHSVVVGSDGFAFFLSANVDC